MTLYVIIHNHQFGTNTHLVKAKMKPSTAWLKEAVLEDYDERGGDTLEIYGHSTAMCYPENKEITLFE